MVNDDLDAAAFEARGFERARSRYRRNEVAYKTQMNAENTRLREAEEQAQLLAEHRDRLMAENARLRKVVAQLRASIAAAGLDESIVGEAIAAARMK